MLQDKKHAFYRWVGVKACFLPNKHAFPLGAEIYCNAWNFAGCTATQRNAIAMKFNEFQRTVTQCRRADCHVQQAIAYQRNAKRRSKAFYRLQPATYPTLKTVCR